MEPADDKSQYQKISITIPDYVYRKLLRIKKSIGSTTSGAVSFAIQLVDLEKLPPIDDEDGIARRFDPVIDVASAIGLDDIGNQLAQEALERSPVAARLVELAADPADRAKPARRLVQRGARLRVGHVAPLQRDQAGDHLQVVADAVLKLAEEKLARLR